jgi:hypothetical protein
MRPSAIPAHPITDTLADMTAMRTTGTLTMLGAAGLGLALLPPSGAPWTGEGGRGPQSALHLDLHLSLPTDDAVYFGSATDADVWSDGRVAVLDGLAKSIYVFDRDGSVIDTIGREGAGPGEMRLASNLAIGPEGRVAVADISNARITVWSATGEYLQAVRILPGWTGRRHLTWNAGGMTYKVTPFGPPAVRFYRVDLPADSLELVLDIPGEEISRAGPTCTFCAYAASAAGRFIVGAPDTLYQLSVLDSAGDTTLVYERTDLPAVRRSEAELEALRERLRRGPGGVERSGRPPEPPAYKPRMTGIAVDAQDRLWVQLNTEDGALGALDVFDRDGEYRTTLSIDPTVQLLRIREEWLLAAGESAAGEPIVLVYRILG